MMKRVKTVINYQTYNGKVQWYERNVYTYWKREKKTNKNQNEGKKKKDIETVLVHRVTKRKNTVNGSATEVRLVRLLSVTLIVRQQRKIIKKKK